MVENRRSLAGPARRAALCLAVCLLLHEGTHPKYAAFRETREGHRHPASSCYPRHRRRPNGIGTRKPSAATILA